MLNSLSTHSLVLRSPECLKAWKAVLRDDTTDKNEIARGLHKLILLHRCPLLMDLDLVSLAEYFNQLSLPVLAIDCLVHQSDQSERMQSISDFINDTNLQSVLEHLKELRQVASNLYHLDEVTRVIFLTLANKGMILNLKRFSYFEWFEKHMMNESELNSLLIYAAQNQMLVCCCTNDCMWYTV